MLTEKGHIVVGGSRRTGFDQSEEACWRDIKRFGPFDLIFVNAGICEFDPESEYQSNYDIVNINFMGVYYALRNLNDLLAVGGTCWVTSSSCAYNSSVDHPLYAASKTAACELVKSFAKLYNGKYKVNAILPGFVATNLGGQQGSIPRELLEAVPLRRAMSPYEAAENLFKLSSIDYLNGALIIMDGGEHV